VKIILGLIAFIGTASCSTTGNEQVRITRNSQATAGCKFIQNVEATGSGGVEHMEKKLRDEGARVGADLVYLPPRSERGFTIYGEAYRCSTSPATLPK
jgi:hypothetical protein